MNKPVRIAVSGVGGGVGQSIIKALSGTEYQVVALDGEMLGTGLYAADTSYVIPYASDPKFVERVLEICQAEGCTLFFPGLDAELPVLSRAVDQFANAGIRLIVSSPEVVELSDNKLFTYETLTSHGIVVPKTVDMAAYEGGPVALDYPFILKKRVGGARSQDMYIIKNEQQLSSLLQQGVDLTPYIAQEYIEGDEYTCGSVNLDGECMGVIVMRRILRDGDTYKCFSVKHELIESTVRKVMAAIKPFGACNVQLRLKDGVPYVFEINARCSGTTAARALCGFNEPLMIADYLSLGTRPSYTITEQTILRYWNELIVPNEAVDELQKRGTLKRTDHPQL